MFKFENIKALVEEIQKANHFLSKNNELFEQMIAKQKEICEKLDRVANLETEFLERLTSHLAFDMKIKKEQKEEMERREQEMKPSPYDLKY